MEIISKRQLFSLTILEQIGSTSIWALGIEAKQDAWIVILFSMLIGFIFLWLYTEIYRSFPKENIAGITTSLLGKLIGIPLAFIYALFFLFNATRNTSEFGDLIKMTFLVNTPRVVIMFVFLVTIIYMLFLRIETLARLTEIVMPIILLLIVSIYLMVIASGIVDLKQLRPSLADGIMPVLKASYPVVINFPFGEIFILMQLWQFVEPKESIRKPTFLAVCISGILLTFSLIIIISVLGVDFAASATIPLLEVIRAINIANIITNLDAIGVILIFVGGFYMATLNFFAGTIILASLFKIKDYRWLLIPLGIFILWYSNVYEPNYPYHVKFLKLQFVQQFVPLYNLIPIFLLLIIKFKNCETKKKLRDE
jgi:spore germination protein KB